MRALWLTLLLLLPSLALAQTASPTGRLTGLVRDAGTGTPLAGATVSLFTSPDTAFVTGTATSADGRFQLDGIPAGTYQVRASFVGYTAANAEDVAVTARTATEVAPFSLETDATALEGVEVSAQRELVEQRVDRTMYNVAAQPVTAGGHALDVLETLPSIEVDAEGRLSLRGGQNVAVHLNGRPVPVQGDQLAALLRQIPAESVERVEVMPNPSARYDADGMSGIIDIVLKKSTNRGLSGGATLGTGTAPNTQLGGNLAYQRGPLDVSGSYTYRYDAFGIDGTSLQRRQLAAGTSVIDQTIVIENGIRSHLGTGTLDWRPNDATLLGISGTLGHRDRADDQQIGVVFGLGPDIEATLDRSGDIASDGLTLDVVTTAEFKPGENRSLSSEFRWTRNDVEEDERFLDIDAAQREAFSARLSDDQNDEFALQADYTASLAGVQVETGAKGTARFIRADLDTRFGEALQLDPALSGLFAYDETVAAAYLQGMRSFGALQVQAGLRVEDARRDVEPGTGQAGIEDRFTSFYPSAFALYTFSPGTTLKASTSRRVNRPNARLLDPTPRFQDTLIVDIGNPRLQPEYTTAYELAFQYKFIATLTPFYRRTTDTIRRRIRLDAETGRTLATFQNLDVQDAYGIETTLSPRIGPVRGVLSASVFRAITEGGNVETDLGSDGLVYTLNGNLQAEIRKGTTVQLFGFYRGPLEVEDGRISPLGFATLGLSHAFNQQVRLALNVRDIFGTGQFDFETGGEGYSFTGTRSPYLQQATVTLTYSFGSGSSRRPRRSSGDQGGSQPDLGI
ncbi:MAG: TonB-dependent receptor [Bacteroidota bacterium]